MIEMLIKIPDLLFFIYYHFYLRNFDLRNIVKWNKVLVAASCNRFFRFFVI